MTDIKEDFKNWLISDKNYKKSTTVNFVTKINNVCKCFFGSNDSENWDNLAVNIVPILVYYCECSNQEYFISGADIDILRQHFNKRIIPYLKQNSVYKKDIFPSANVSLIYKGQEHFISKAPLSNFSNYLQIFHIIIDNLNLIYKDGLNDNNLSKQLYVLAKIKKIDITYPSDFLDRAVSILLKSVDSQEERPYLYFQYTEKNARQQKNALWLLYEFLNTSSAFLPKQNPYLAYDELKNLIICINNAHDGLIKIETTVTWTGNRAKVIKAKDSDGILYSKEVQEALECSPAAFRALVKNKILKPIKENKRRYIEDDVNDLLKKSFNKVTYPGVDYTQLKCNKLRRHPEIWCNRGSAAKILNRNVSTIDSYKEEKLLTYIEMVQNSTFFYVPELKKIAKILKKYPSRESKRMLIIKLKSVIKQ